MPWRKKDRHPLDGRNQNDDGSTDLPFDDSFVQEAPVIELSAEQRAAQRRRDDFYGEMDEAFRRAEQAARGARSAKRRRRVPAVLAIVAVVSVLGWREVQSGQAPPASLPPDEAIDAGPDRVVRDTTLTDIPPPSAEEAAAPLGRPAPHAVLPDGFKFAWLQPGSDAPVAYDPCRPVHVVVNSRTAPPGADAILGAALEAVRKATGLVFIVDGPTDEAPSADRPPYQPDRYPNRWAPVLVAWSDPAESPALAGPVAGSGGSVWLTVGDDRVGDDRVGGDRLYVTGSVTLDGLQLQQILDDRNGRAEVRAVIEHELGHLVGLDHVPDPTQLMNPVREPGHRSFGAGDLTGLGLLGQGRCFPTV